MTPVPAALLSASFQSSATIEAYFVACVDATTTATKSAGTAIARLPRNCQKNGRCMTFTHNISAVGVLAEGFDTVLPDWIQAFPGPVLYYPSRTLMPAPLRAFVHFFKANPRRH